MHVRSKSLFYSIKVDSPAAASRSQVHMFPLSAMFGLCATFLFIAAALMVKLEQVARNTPIIRGMPETDALIGGDKTASGGL